MSVVGAYPSKLEDLPAELLLKAISFLDQAEDLQNVRLVNKAFSKVGTIELQDRFVRLHVSPTKTSVARFTKLTVNTLIAPKITQLVVLYSSPYATPAPSSACVSASKNYDLSWPMCKEIISEYNDNCFSPTLVTDADGDAPGQEMSVVKSGEFERILGEGIQKLSALRFVIMRSDMSGPVKISCSLNLPEHLQYVNTRTGTFDATRYPTKADLTRFVMYRSLYQSRLGKGSLEKILGALNEWSSDLDGQHRSLTFLVSAAGCPNAQFPFGVSTSRSQVLHDSLANITRISLLVQGQRLSLPRAKSLDRMGQRHSGLSIGPYWFTLLQAAKNLKSLQIKDISSDPVGFDNLLHNVFQNGVWPSLTGLSLVRTSNIKLLPVKLFNCDYSIGWHLFLQEDLDKFLLRHRTSLERLKLRNIVGLERPATPPAYALQFIGDQFPDDPTPSLSALRNSLELWQRTLSRLSEIDVLVRAKVYHSHDTGTPFDEWLRRSDIQALATALDVEAERTDSLEEGSEWSQVDFHFADSMKSTKHGVALRSMNRWCFAQDDAEMI